MCAARETALIASIEGRRGEPRPRPPFPAVSGLWGKPSNINNVKSYAMSPRILLRGASWFKNIGTPKSSGTAIFALTGRVNNTGLLPSVPMGIPLGDIIFDVGGGIPGGRLFGRADRRPARRLPAGVIAEHAGGFRFASGSRRGDGQRRHDCRGRRHLHGRAGEILSQVLKR